MGLRATALQTARGKMKRVTDPPDLLREKGRGSGMWGGGKRGKNKGPLIKGGDHNKFAPP